MSQNELRRWIKIASINLLIVALMGLIMRYKIGFSLRWIDQKNLLHAHSHFAFNGWVSLLLMVLMIQLLNGTNHLKFKYLLILQLINAWALLFSFILSGYSTISIILSTLSIIIALLFAIYYVTALRHLKHLKQPYWMYAGLLFNLISSFGTFVLAYMFSHKQIDQHLYLAAVYWFLHFQYNGWFFFICMGLFSHYAYTKWRFQVKRKIFYAFAFSCLPAYGLSILWAHLPIWIYWIVFVAAITQLSAWVYLLFDFKNTIKSDMLHPFKWPDYLFYFLVVAVTIKFLVQAISVIPSVSKLAFGFRPVVIAYLHLVLLAIITIFLICYSTVNHFLPIHSTVFKTGVLLFSSGIFINEILLATQGIFSFSYISIPGIDFALFGVALILFFGVLLMVISQFGKEQLFTNTLKSSHL